MFVCVIVKSRSMAYCFMNEGRRVCLVLEKQNEKGARKEKRRRPAVEEWELALATPSVLNGAIIENTILVYYGMSV